MGYIGRMPYNAHINTLFKGDYTGFRPIWGGFGVVGVWDPGWLAADDGGSVVVQIMLYIDCGSTFAHMYTCAQLYMAQYHVCRVDNSC